MSDTPRTDEQINGKPCSRFGILAGDSLRNAAVPSEFARILEREINAANDDIKRLEEENNELRAEEARLLNTNGELERRIKRLIDAGDAMLPWSERVGQEFWTKAKEAK
jgi:uncharacterized protein YdcH (DUF465 family)